MFKILKSNKAIIAVLVAAVLITPFVSLAAGTPVAITDEATDITSNSARLQGRVFPNGSYTSVWIEYGTTSALGSRINTPGVSSVNDIVDVTGTLSGLTAGRTYYYRVVADNSYGRSNGSTMNFTALSGGGGGGGSLGAPTTVTGEATSITSSGAFLKGQVDPRGRATSVWFEVGPTQNLGLTTPAETVSGTYGARAVSRSVGTLSPSTTYYYRVVAANSSGASAGQLSTFRTAAAPIIEPPLPPAPNPNPGPAPTSTPPEPPAPTPTSTPPDSGGDDITGGGLSACVAVRSDLSNPTVIPGDEFTFTVTYRNDCESSLRNARLSVELPDGVSFAANFPVLSQEGGNVSYDVGMIGAGFQSSIITRAELSPEAVPDESLFFQANLMFENQSGASRTVAANNVGRVGEASTATANIIDIFEGIAGAWWFWVLVVFIVLFFVFWMVARRKAGDEDE